MRVGIIPSGDLSYNSGSVIFAKRLASFLVNRGHEVTLLASKLPADLSVSERLKVVADSRLLDHPLFMDRPVRSIDQLRALSAMVEILAREHSLSSFDVVHSHYASINSFAASIFFALTSVPYVVSCFGRDLTKGVTVGDRAFERMFRYSLSQAAYITVPDQSLHNSLQRHFADLDVARNAATIAMPVDPVIMERPSTDRVREESLIASINSCFTPEKGIFTLLRALGAWPGRRPKSIVAGTDDHPEKRNLREVEDMVYSLGLCDDVTFPGFLAREQVRDLLRRASVLVDARDRGNFSSVLLEAQFTGCPAIAADTPAARLIIEDGKNGILFPPGDHVALQARLREVLTIPGLREELRVNMAEWVATAGKQYTTDHCFGAYETILTSACFRAR